MPNAKANYIISAQDATQDAIRSIQSNFRSLDSGVKATARGVNAALGVFVGAGIKSLFRSSLEAAAEASGKNSEFSKTLDDIRKSASDLMVPSSGLPSVTENMKELAATLKDPAVRTAADALFSSLLRGGTASASMLAKTVAGLRVIGGAGGNQQVDVDTQIRNLQEQLDLGKRGGMASYIRDELQQQVDALQRSYDVMTNIVSGSSFGDPLASVTDGSGASKAIDSAVSAYEAADAAAKQYEETVKELQKTLASLPYETAQAASESLNQSLKDEQDAAERRDEYFKSTQEKYKEQSEKGAELTRQMLDKQTEFARQAARNMQDALADFLFDPFKDGLKGMLKGFIDTLRRMIAEAAAAKIFGILGGLGKSGGSSSILKGIGAFFGGFKAEGGPLQSGKWYIAGERGPEPVWGGGPGAFATGYGGGGSGVVVSPVYNIDARGATQDVIAALPGILRENNRQMEASIISKLRRGNYEARLA